ncbi:hypothetical protein fHeYen901_144 [Yersinia phage fHe-Yen9-01]|uniref:Uncharacterized protein n=1 Tax=Yersinia phage fHe-Yen9-01 TaxID=1965363 RepID=A0A1V0DXP1_9CAUD|nr:hypothetical protein KNT60_gp143 [Yersinia phage fHe-Yen9-01]ARB05917.1 hypothetical protein fHeYen901_144 [Yersinia phage fHe-Yen9-01]
MSELDEAVKAIRAAINKAIEIAEKENATFDIYPAYGMGGTYHSAGALDKEEAFAKSVNGDMEWTTRALYDVSENKGCWVSSTQECN